ncbi:MAG: alpha/beta hydrolase [Ilumatobacteraceae bacterium]
MTFTETRHTRFVSHTTVVVMSLLVLVACNSSKGVTTESTPTTSGGTSSRTEAVRSWSSDIVWTACGDGLQCGSFDVPLDYSAPSAGVFTLPIVKHVATATNSRIGSLLINPGGPGGAALDFARYADSIFSETLLERFDIVAWDPRGVGGSVPSIDCVDSMDDYFALDPSPDDEIETQELLSGARTFVDGCRERSGAILDHVNTVDAASDIDVLRRALGEETISYFGFSYGTQLGATWASLFPDTVRAATLDAAVDPTRGYVDGLVQQAAGFESSLDAFFDWCDANQCDYIDEGSDARASFDALVESLNSSPLVNDDRPPTNEGVLGIAVAQALYSQSMWSSLAMNLSAAKDGDGAGLLTMFDDYFGGYSGGHLDNLIDAYFVISCSDRDTNVSPEEILGLKDRLANVAPRLGSGWIQEMLICAHWPSQPSDLPIIAADTSARIVVVGSIGDAATPLTGTRNMVRQLGHARLIVSPLEQHTTYGSDDCVTAEVDEYLVNLTDGPDVLDC